MGSEYSHCCITFTRSRSRRRPSALELLPAFFAARRLHSSTAAVRYLNKWGALVVTACRYFSEVKSSTILSNPFPDASFQKTKRLQWSSHVRWCSASRAVILCDDARD